MRALSMPSVFCSLALLALLGCRPEATDPDEPVEAASLQDGDGDGYAAAADCDDARPAVNPSAPERCDGLDNDCDGAIDEDDAIDGARWFADGDGDGFGALEYSRAACEQPDGFLSDFSDCDDLDPLINPDGVEICDGVDNDCDGVADEDSAQDAASWYADLDGDGYGNPDWSVPGCDPPEGFILDDTDCDDTRPDVNPGEAERCDDTALDEDCDGLWDEHDTDPLNATRYYPDADGDGYGLWVGFVDTCAAPEGFAEEGGDCDDADGRVYPGAAEQCGDGVDNDCDAEVDEDEGRGLDWYADADGDGYGDPSAALGASCAARAGASASPLDCDDADAEVFPGAAEIWYDGVDQDCAGDDDDDADADGQAADAVGGPDCDDADPDTFLGAPERCGDGRDQDCDGAVDTCGVRAWISGGAGDAAGGALVWAGDLNGDGLDDAVLGARLDDAGGRGAGTAYVVFAPVDRDLTTSFADAALSGVEVNGYAGSSLAAPGDLDGDGYPELAVGAPGSDGGGEDAGSLFIASGPVRGRDPLDEAGWEILGEAAGDRAASALAATGDVSGDGLPDLLIGGPGHDGAGAVWLIAGPAADVDLSWAVARWTSAEAGADAGGAVAAADLDGDGVPDLAVGAPVAGLADGYNGELMVLLDPSPGDGALEDAPLGWWGDVGAGWGRRLAAVGDTDGDGLDELVAGAEGLAALVALEEGWSSISGAPARITGEAGDDLGGSVSGAGDLDGDGLMDLVVGAPGADLAASDGGVALVYFGPLSGALGRGDATAMVLGESANGLLGSAVAGGGDGDGDGLSDLLLGAPGAEGGAGAVGVLLGGW